MSDPADQDPTERERPAVAPQRPRPGNLEVSPVVSLVLAVICIPFALFALMVGLAMFGLLLFPMVISGGLALWVLLDNKRTGRKGIFGWVFLLIALAFVGLGLVVVSASA